MRQCGRRAYVITCVLGIGLAVAGCGQADGSPRSPSGSPSGSSSGSSPRPPSVAGKLLVLADDEFQLLTQAADGHLSMTPFGVTRSTDFEFEVTADHTLFVYRDGAVVTARNLADGTERRLGGDAAKEGLCLRTSPDGRHVSYRRADDLVVVDLNGAVTVLDRVKRATYNTDGGTVTASAELGCAAWLDDTHVSFQRRKQLPKNATVTLTPAGPVVLADTTTVAVLGGTSPKLIDTPAMWNPTAVCGHRMAINPGKTTEPLRLRDGWVDADLTKVNALTGPDLALAGATGSTHHVLFIPGTCEALLYSDDSRAIQSIDPATRKVDDRPIVTLPAGGNDVLLYDDPAIWQPGQDSRVLAAIVKSQIVVVDLRAGTAIPVPADGLDSASLMLAWLP